MLCRKVNCILDKNEYLMFFLFFLEIGKLMVLGWMIVLNMFNMYMVDVCIVYVCYY